MTATWPKKKRQIARNGHHARRSGQVNRSRQTTQQGLSLYMIHNRSSNATDNATETNRIDISLFCCGVLLAMLGHLTLSLLMFSTLGTLTLAQRCRAPARNNLLISQSCKYSSRTSQAEYKLTLRTGPQTVSGATLNGASSGVLGSDSEAPGDLGC